MLRLHQVFLLLLAVFEVGNAEATSNQLRRATEEEALDPGEVAPAVPSDISRIRGGFDVANPLPWLGVFDDTILCGCVLVHSDIVVTTANCLNDNGFPSAVRIGSLQRDSGGTVVNIIGGLIHPDWTGDPAQGNDVAVLRLETALTNTVALLNEDPHVPFDGNDELFMAGFGLIDNTNFPTTLQGLFLNNVENCFERAPPVYNPVFHFCGDASATQGTCAGDSGIPIIIPGTRLMVGLNSFSDQNCELQSIDVYTRISSYSIWIKKYICDYSNNPPASCDEYTSDPCLWDFVIGTVTGWLGF